MTAQIKRYFLFSYMWQGSTVSGLGSVGIESNRFPSYAYVKQEASNLCPETPVSITINSWNEFRDKDDFDAFIDTAETLK